MLKIVADGTDRDDLAGMLDELVAEVADYVDRHQQVVDEAGRRLVVRNGKAAERTLVTAAGGLKIRAPRVDDRREGQRFSSHTLPKYARRSPKVADVLPVLYLRGLSTGDFVPIWPNHGWLIALALGSQVGGWLLIGYALPRLQAAETATIILLQPMLTMVWGALIFGEHASAIQLVGACLVLLGVAFVAVTSSRRTPQPITA